MPVTATSLAAATTMLAAVVAIFVTFVLCFYLFLCAKRYRGAAPTLTGARGRARFVFSGEDSAPWCRGRGLDEATIAALPRKEVRKDEAVDCAVCITELAAGEAARFLPRCGHGFHVDCIDMWLPSHSTCPLCRCPVVDAPPHAAAPATVPPEADQESPNFPTNVLYFGSQDAVSTGGSAPPPQAPTPMPPPLPPPAPVAAVAAIVEAARVHALRRLLGCGGATPMPQPQAEGDIETGLAGGESSVSRPAKPQAG